MMKGLYIGTIDGIFGYGLSVAALTEEEVLINLERAYNEWSETEGREDDYPDQLDENGNPMTRFQKAFDYWGGDVRKIELGKVYYDNFGE